MVWTRSEILLKASVERRQGETEPFCDVRHLQRLRTAFLQKFPYFLHFRRNRDRFPAVTEKLEQFKTDAAVDLAAFRALVVVVDIRFQPVEQSKEPFFICQRKDGRPVEPQELQELRQRQSVHDHGCKTGRDARLKIVIVISLAMEQAEVSFFRNECLSARPEPQFPLQNVFDGEKRLVDPVDVAVSVPVHQ